MILEYARMRDTAKPPVRSNPSDAGLDIFYNPENAEATTIEPGTSAVLQTGYRFGVPHGYMLEVKNRSGLASKRERKSPKLSWYRLFISEHLRPTAATYTIGILLP